MLDVHQKGKVGMRGLKGLTFVMSVGLCCGAALPFAWPIDKCLVGLILNMVGVVVTFKFALPQQDYYDAVCVRVLEGDEITGASAADCEEEAKRRKKSQRVWAIVGLAYLLVGLALQAIHQLYIGE